MSLYHLKLQSEKIDRLIQQHQFATEQFISQRQVALEQLVLRRKGISEGIAAAEQATPSGEPAKSEPQSDEVPAAVLAAEKALNSNSSFLMRSRMQPLSDAMSVIKDRRNAVADGAWNGVPADEELYDRLGTIKNRWNELWLALRARAEALERAAADKIQNRDRLAAWHQERKENAEATKQCAIDRARCLASRKETQ